MATLTAARLLPMLRGQRFPLHNEKELQLHLSLYLAGLGIAHEREKTLSKKDIIDFYFPGGLGVELKLNGGKSAIYRQCERYCRSEEIKELLLITNKQLGLPPLIEGKPTHIFNLGLGWL